MARDRNEATLLIGQLDRATGLSANILRNFDARAPLSSVLSTARGLAALRGDTETVALIDFMIYGVGQVPGIQVPYSDPAYLKALDRFWSIFSVVDSEKALLAASSNQRNKVLPRELVATAAVSVLEQGDAPTALQPGASAGQFHRWLILKHSHDQTQAALYRAKAWVYQYVFNVSQQAALEKQALSLLGPDYRIVLSSLAVLDTEVGAELRAALDALGSDNPASWALAALGCRSVVLKLGRLLWKSNVPTYNSQLHKRKLTIQADQTGDKEVNKLCAYMDNAAENALQSDKKLLEEADGLLHVVYQVGSKGKGGAESARYSEARKIVVDTFRLVDILVQVTGLTPLVTLPNAQPPS
ncbi:MAG: hypothetical protein HY683_06195 [Chloroflexi bacterium]|nr:hypothetical protein [Chloroflexota bacterium]